LDDDPNKRHRQIAGVKVVGTLADLVGAARRHTADAIVLSIPSANSELIQRVIRSANDAGLDVVMPNLLISPATMCPTGLEGRTESVADAS
jgi:FlaA1/EpsC-like NDP-sugar epimerase